VASRYAPRYRAPWRQVTVTDAAGIRSFTRVGRRGKGAGQRPETRSDSARRLLGDMFGGASDGAISIDPPSADCRNRTEPSSDWCNLMTKSRRRSRTLDRTRARSGSPDAGARGRPRRSA
jgi:hypothetical protein